eukprot:scaffold148066_cov34-Tisochrysis_lutea.AAC.3
MASRGRRWPLCLPSLPPLPRPAGMPQGMDRGGAQPSLNTTYCLASLLWLLVEKSLVQRRQSSLPSNEER